MKLRFCERCSAEVEDVDGFCLLGHPLPAVQFVGYVLDGDGTVLDEVSFEDERTAQKWTAERLGSTPGAVLVGRPTVRIRKDTWSSLTARG